MSVMAFEVVDSDDAVVSDQKMMGASGVVIPLEKPIPIYVSELSAKAAGLISGDKYASMVGLDLIVKVVK